MRTPRIRGEGLSYYHCVSRVVDQRFIFQDHEREYFVSLMRKLEAFSGMRVVTYCVMSNHFHLLVEEPDQEDLAPLTADELLRRLRLLYSSHHVKSVEQELQRARDSGNAEWENQILARHQARIGNLPVFMKELKQRFTQWYNRRTGRSGTLWEQRYKSTLVEGDPHALMTIAAYIDLNPIRAHLVSSPEDYRWCGYASAAGGDHRAREGLGRILSASRHVCGEEFEQAWEETASTYRLWLYDQGEHREIPESGERRGRGGFSAEESEAEIAREGRMSLGEALRCRVRYFTDGAVLGSAGFIESVFERNRAHFGEKRKTGARRMRDADWGGLCVLRDLRGRRIG